VLFYSTRFHFRCLVLYQVNWFSFVMNPHFPKCLLCGNQSLQLQLRSRNQSILTKWRRRVAVSLWQILELDDTFEDIFSDVTFCYRCQEIVCNAEFTVNAISRLQRELGCIRENIKSLILCNYHEVIAPTHIPFQGRENDSYDSDPDMDASYNRTVERIVRRMGVQAEPVPSDVDENDNENMELAESKESSFPGILPTSRPPPRQHPQRLAALKKRQKRQRPDPLTKSSNMKSSTNDSSLSLISKKRKQEPALSSFDPLENITTYSRYFCREIHLLQINLLVRQKNNNSNFFTSFHFFSDLDGK